MIFIVYTQINDEKLNGSLGMPEYSYYFVLKGFLPVLKELGQVIVVSDPEQEVDVIYDDCRKHKEDCVFISFSPPNKTAVGLRCPTVCVFAWEFDRIPDEVWDGNRKNDWRYVLGNHGRAITLSNYSAEAVKKAMDGNFHVESIPVPVWDKFREFRNRHCKPSIKKTVTMTLKGNVIDSSNYSITADTFELKNPFSGIELYDLPRHKIHMGFTNKDEFTAYLGGFYLPEPWGTWSHIAEPWVLLPYKLIGCINLKIILSGYGYNANKEIDISIGDDKKKIRLSVGVSEENLSFHITEPANLIKFSGIDLSPVPNAADPRSMGIGLRSIELSLDSYSNNGQRAISKNSLRDVSINGIVYTSVFNPADDRKNWMDMIKGFCWAFRETEDATLVLKMTHQSVSSFLGDLHILLHQSWPFKCRIVTLHGYLDDGEYEKLIACSSFYVNTSHCEGLCLPLMEFMSCGVPAVAPCTTALADYVDNSTTFIVKSSLEPWIWPHDSRQLLRTLQYRLDWESLVAAFETSYKTARDKPDSYMRMANASLLKMKEYSSKSVIKEKIQTFLKNRRDPW